MGEHDVRVITPNGISNRYRFFVSELSEICEVEPNNEFATAQTLPPLPVLVNGRIDQSDEDFFRFSAKAGQTIVCSVQARAILPYIADAVPGWFDPVLTLQDSGGKLLQTVNGYRFKIDPVLIFKVPQDGDFVLRIRDVLYRGRPDFIYRLSLGQLPFISHIFPLGGRRNSSVSLELHGANLPETTRKVDLSGDPDPRRSLTVSANGLTSNRVVLAAGDLPEITETEPNDTLATAQKIEIPVVINGRIQKSGDSDYFAFTVKQKQQLVVEVQARRLDSPLDSILTVSDSNGVELAENDDTPDNAEPLITHHADSRIVRTYAPGEYVVRIRDVEQKGGNEYAYRLSLAPPHPDFALRVTPANAIAGQGDSAVVNVAALRRDGFSGEVALSVQGLPTGSTVGGAVIPAGLDEASVTITVQASASLGLSSPVILGTGTIEGRQVTRTAIPAEPAMQAFATTHNVLTKEFLLGIAEPPPISITTSSPPNKVLEIKQGGELQITVKAVRKPGVTGPITLGAQKPASGFGVRTPFIPAEKDESVVVITALKGTPVATTQSIVISGTIKAARTGVSVAPAIAVKVISGDEPKPQ